MVRTPCCKEEGIKKGAWTPEEDQKLIAYLQLHGEGGWRTLPQKAGLKRCGKSCRLRWANYLRPDIKRGEFSPEEDDTIIKLHALNGNKWAAIAASLEGRTDNDIKNYWNTNLKKRLKQKGLIPKIPKPVKSTDQTHQPINSTVQTGLEPKIPKPVGSSGSARFLNRVASKYAVDLNRDLLTGIITSKVDSPTDNSTNKMAAKSSALTSIMINTASPSSGFSENYSFSDDFTEFFSNEERISDMYKNVDSTGIMEELKGILSYGNAGAGDTRDSPDVNVTDGRELLVSWSEEDDMDLEKFVSSLDSKFGVFV